MATPEHPAIIGQSTWLLDIIFDLINYSQSLRDIDLVVEQPVTMLFDEVSPSEEEHYKTYYGDREIFAQVYMFDMLTRMDEKQPALMAFVKRLREMMFAPWTENFSGMSIWVSWKKVSWSSPGW